MNHEELRINNTHTHTKNHCKLSVVVHFDKILFLCFRINKKIIVPDLLNAKDGMVVEFISNVH